MSASFALKPCGELLLPTWTIESTVWFVLNGGDSTCAQLFGIADVEHKARKKKLEIAFPNGEGTSYLIGTNKQTPTVLSWEALVRFVFLHGKGEAANKFISFISRISYENLDSFMEMEMDVEEIADDLEDRELGDAAAEALLGELDAEALLEDVEPDLEAILQEPPVETKFEFLEKVRNCSINIRKDPRMIFSKKFCSNGDPMKDVDEIYSLDLVSMSHIIETEVQYRPLEEFLSVISRPFDLDPVEDGGEKDDVEMEDIGSRERSIEKGTFLLSPLSARY